MLINYILGGIVLNYLFNKKQKGGRTRNKTVTLNGEEYDVDKILEYFQKDHPGGHPGDHPGGNLNINKIKSTFINKDKKNYDPENTLLYIWERNGVKWHGNNKRVLEVLKKSQQ